MSIGEIFKSAYTLSRKNLFADSILKYKKPFEKTIGKTKGLA